MKTRAAVLARLVTVAVTSVCCLPVSLGLGQRVYTVYQQGIAAYRSGDYSQAAALFSKVESDSPGQTDALLYVGLSEIHIGHPALAETVLLAYLRRNPDSFRALEALGTLQEEENKPADSLRTFTQAASLHVPSSDDLDRVARDYVLLNDYPDAIHWLRKATAADPGNEGAWYDLGRCYYSQSLFPLAQQALEHAQALDPDNVRVASNLGLTLDAENLPDQAEKQYRRAVILARKKPAVNEWPFVDYGTFLLEQGRAAEAIPQLQAAVSANPKCAQCYTLLGRAMAQAGNVGEGIKQLETAIGLSPKDANAHYQLGRLYKSTGQDRLAREQFSISAQLYGTNSHAGSKE